MSVDIVATKDDVLAVEVATTLLLEEFNGMPIIDDNDVVIGMITVVDLLHAVSDGKDLETMLARDLMTKNPLVVTQDTKVEDIVDIMYKNGLEIIPVVDKQADSRLIGIVSSSDTLTEKMNEFLQ